MRAIEMMIPVTSADYEKHHVCMAECVFSSCRWRRSEIAVMMNSNNHNMPFIVMVTDCNKV